MFLRAIQFIPDVSVVIGGKYSALTFWDFERYPDVFVELRENGDVWLTTAWDGRRRIVNSHAVAWVLMEPEHTGAEAEKIAVAMKKHREAKQQWAEKFGSKNKPIQGTEGRK